MSMKRMILNIGITSSYNRATFDLEKSNEYRNLAIDPKKESMSMEIYDPKLFKILVHTCI